MNKKEVKVHRQMRVIRCWLDGQYRYFALYNDGEYRLSDRKEAEQYARAYEVDIKTIVGLPKEDTWSITGK